MGHLYHITSVTPAVDAVLSPTSNVTNEFDDVLELQICKLLDTTVFAWVCNLMERTAGTKLVTPV